MAFSMLADDGTRAQTYERDLTQRGFRKETRGKYVYWTITRLTAGFKDIDPQETLHM